jgi:hypothetical protein
MFVALDECTEGSVKCIGAISLPCAEYYELEKRWSVIRKENHMWSELKWNDIKDSNSYWTKYLTFIDTFFDFKCSYQCWTYTNPLTDVLQTYFAGNKSLPYHKTAYGLLQSLSWKISFYNRSKNQNYCMYIVPDGGSNQGRNEWKKTREYLEKSHRVKIPISACVEGNSAVCSLIQMADIFTGCAHSEINNSFSSDAKRKIYEYIINKSGEPAFFCNKPNAEWGTFKIDCFDQRRITVPAI